MPKNKTITIDNNDQQIIILLTLGIFTAGFTEGTSILGSRTEVFELLSKAGEKLGFQTVIFGHQHLALDDRRITAYYYKNEKWHKGVFMYPAIIYDRIPNRKIEHHPEVIQAKKRLQDEGIFFNQGFFNKWEIYELLMRSVACSYLIPTTVIHPSESKIIAMTDKFPIYIKPIHGSRGEGIVRCVKLPSGELECHYYLQNKPQVNRYTKISAFFKQHFPNGFKGYVAQKEVDLIKKGKSAIDFRVHCNKNHRNSWEVTLTCAKFAGKGSLTTHVKRGGSVHLLEELFSNERANLIRHRLTTTAEKVSIELEKAIDQPLGEIGFDFGIDNEENVWLFEANAKPGYGIFNHPTIKHEADNILTYPFKYAFYLYNSSKNNDLI
ncbi:YheC/YheD family protein [Radiobacillus sp. PE A8.2]|uniref:YheC/YheD family endospore coat-associated protein n=1 Tax=Radiobacillus sp. PE A8.2 TaxID=3380349 RepID=UPI00388F62E5